MALDTGQWTDDQEITLLKAVIKWKPAGMHKNFRIMAIRQYMIMEGVINEDDPHTSIPGIWKKLGTLYNLPILDEREDLILTDAVDENGAPLDSYGDFDLPADEFGVMMFERRLAPEGTGSPEISFSRRESTVADTDEPRSSPVSVRGSGRNARASARRGRASKLQNEVENSRRTSKATSIADDETMDDVDDGEENEDSGEAQEEEIELEEKGKGGRKGKGQMASTPATRNTAKRARRR